MNYWGVIYRFAMVLLVVLMLVGLVFIFLPPSHAIREYHKRRVDLQAENERLEAQVRELAEKQARFRTDPAFVERTAREAGMLKTNEVIYKLEDEPVNP
ncbi:MAG: septum formation initiator family protein [Lentisphaerae bacterium]|nr:septum formation initiator family protein [Lentisphaerota bacterium]